MYLNCPGKTETLCETLGSQYKCKGTVKYVCICVLALISKLIANWSII